MVDNENGDCAWERPQDGRAYPTILYSNATSKVLWDDILVEGKLPSQRNPERFQVWSAVHAKIMLIVLIILRAPRSRRVSAFGRCPPLRQRIFEQFWEAAVLGLESSRFQSAGSLNQRSQVQIQVQSNFRSHIPKTNKRRNTPTNLLHYDYIMVTCTSVRTSRCHGSKLSYLCLAVRTTIPLTCFWNPTGDRKNKYWFDIKSFLAT